MTRARRVSASKSTDHEPGATKAYFRAFIDEAPVSVAMFDREMRYLAASRRWQQYLCPGESDLTGRSCYEVCPEIPEHWKAACRRGLAGETLGAEEDRFPRADGRTQWVHWEIRPWHQSNGEIGGIIVYADDVTAKVEAEHKLQASSARFADELAARLLVVGSRLRHGQSLSEQLNEVLKAAIEMLGADMGNVQLLSDDGKTLRIAAQHGFTEEFLEFFREVTREGNTACARALRSEALVVIEDVESDAAHAPYRSIARAAGYRAVVSIPVIARGGGSLAVISCHFRSAHRPSTLDLQWLQLYARLAASLIEKYRSLKALREIEERYRLTVEAVKLATFDWDLATGAVIWNDEMYRMLRYEIGEVEPSYAAWADRLHPEDRAAAEATRERTKKLHQDYISEYRIVDPDGSVRWLSARGRFLYQDDKPVRMVGIAEDITQSRQWTETQNVLIAELQHRTRNLLAVVQSIALQTLHRVDSLKDFENRFTGRLEALSRIQGLLSRSQRSPITFRALVTMELEALSSEWQSSRITLAGPEAPLPSRTVQMLALAIHELATNAIKYGAFANEHGQLSVTWRVEGTEATQCLLLEWVETGITPPVSGKDAPRNGYGRMLIEQALPYSLAAKTKFELADAQLRCTIILPIAPATDTEAPK